MSSKGYYQRHKEKILAKRKLRYNADPEFREVHKQRVIVARKKLQERRKAQKDIIKVEKKIWRNFKVKDKVVRCCKIGYVAKSISRSSQTIRKWHLAKLLPETITYKGQRYYTENHYNMLVRFWNLYQKISLSRFFSEVSKNWNTKY